jgi:hypothetical protein
MIQHLPRDVFWAVLEHSDDVKACVAMWVCCKDIYSMYDKSTFWKELSYQKFPATTHRLEETTSLSSKKSRPSDTLTDTFWINYAKQYGCIHCRKPFAKNKTFNGFVESVKLYDMHLFTCTTCKELLGETLVHKRYIEPWQSNILKKMKPNTHTCRPIFQGYYGINQIHQSNGYKTKCITCIKNIRNCLCPHFKCGACCSCRYHKSHYHQFTQDLYHMNVQTLHINEHHSHAPSTTLKMKMKQPRQRPTKMTHSSSNAKTKRYYFVAIEI